KFFLSCSVKKSSSNRKLLKWVNVAILGEIYVIGLFHISNFSRFFKSAILSGILSISLSKISNSLTFPRNFVSRVKLLITLLYKYNVSSFCKRSSMKVMSASLLFYNESHFRLGIVLIFSGNVIKSFLDRSKCAKLSICDRSHGIFVIPVSAKVYRFVLQTYSSARRRTSRFQGDGCFKSQLSQP